MVVGGGGGVRVTVENLTRLALLFLVRINLLGLVSKHPHVLLARVQVKNLHRSRGNHANEFASKKYFFYKFFDFNFNVNFISISTLAML